MGSTQSSQNLLVAVKTFDKEIKRWILPEEYLQPIEIPQFTSKSKPDEFSEVWSKVLTRMQNVSCSIGHLRSIVATINGLNFTAAQTFVDVGSAAFMQTKKDLERLSQIADKHAHAYDDVFQTLKCSAEYMRSMCYMFNTITVS